MPCNFYIDGAYFEPQKQAKPRTFKMTKLALAVVSDGAPLTTSIWSARSRRPARAAASVIHLCTPILGVSPRYDCKKEEVLVRSQKKKPAGCLRGGVVLCACFDKQAKTQSSIFFCEAIDHRGLRGFSTAVRPLELRRRVAPRGARRSRVAGSISTSKVGKLRGPQPRKRNVFFVITPPPGAFYVGSFGIALNSTT